LGPNSLRTEEPDALLGGRLTLFQPRTGHRAGSDAVLLAACVPAGAEGRAIDVGAGVGAAGLGALLRAPALDMTFVEIDADLVEFCNRNIAGNGFSGRARALEADLLAPRRAAGSSDGTFDLVITNPPFHQAGAVRPPPDPKKARAYVIESQGAWMKAAFALLAPGGTFLMIHRADALPEILETARGRIGGVRILPILPRAKAAAIRVLVAGRKGSRAPLEVLPQIVLHGESGGFTPQAEAIHRGEAGVDLGL
jgi:tRNA1(Val) A37 N6-methylase TrmN6